MKKTKLALTAIVAFAAATLATGAVAHEGTNAHKHGHADHHADHHAGHHAGHVETTETHSSSFSHSSSNAKVDALESQLQAMQAEIRSLRAASGHHQVDPDTAKVQELDQWMNSVKADGHSSAKGAKDNMVFFRGGYTFGDDSRGGLGATAGAGLLGAANLGTTGDPLAGGAAVNSDAWYFGAGFDWSLSDNVFGLVPNTEVAAELMFDYREFSDKATSPLTGSKLTVNSITLAASPKIKFLKGSAFRPWLIPAGFELNVISPPSNGVTYINPGIQFGAGADYKIWKDIYVGADARYHYTADNDDGVNTDGVTAGGYLGLGF